MDNFVYNTFETYFQTLEKFGYMNKKSVDSLLILDFLYNLTAHDYRGYITREDYHTIEQALNCLYGSTCLIPYPDYLKMGKLRLGEMTELAERTKNLEAYDEELDVRILENDVLIEDNIRRLDEYGGRLDDHDRTLAQHTEHLRLHDIHLAEHDEHLAHHDYLLGKHKERLDKHAGEIANHEQRITTAEGTLRQHGNRLDAIESTKVVKGKEQIKVIAPIDFNVEDD